MTTLPQEQPLGEPRTIKDLIGEAIEDSQNIISGHRHIFDELGVTGPMPSDRRCWIISEALEAAASTKDGHKDLRALFEMLCAINISAGFQTIGSQEDRPEAVYLVAFWHGILTAVKWMDRDSIVGAFKELHRSELSSMARPDREAQKAAELSRLVSLARTLRETSAKHTIDSVFDDVLSQSSNRLITFDNLVLQCFDQDIDELANKGLSLWQAGSTKFHGVIADELLKKIFPKSRTKISIRKELMKRLADLADKNGFTDQIRGRNKK